MQPTLARRAVAEALGTALLVAAVVGSGIMGERLAAGNVAAMREIGIDISAHRSKPVDEFAGQEFDYVITVCDNA